MLSIQNINKQFPGVKALDNVSFEILPGEVHALIGENGAGKSTLMNIIMGILQPDSGKLILENEEINLHTPKDAIDLGISMLFQEVSLVPSISIAENIYLADLPSKGRGTSLIDWATLYKNAEEVCKKVGLDVNPKQKVRKISIGKQQLIQLAKAIVSNPKIVIMDEPTASLSSKETETLFSAIRELKRNGISVIYISHRLEEIFEIAQRVSILRDGKYIDTVNADEVTKDDLISLMVGRYLNILYTDKEHLKGDSAIMIEKLTKPELFEDISFEVMEGEVFGIYGLVGAGRTELAHGIFGVYPDISGRIFIKGKEVKIRSPRDAIKRGIMYLPEERKEESIIGKMSVRENITISNLKAYSKFIFPKISKEKEVSQAYVDRMKIKISSLNQKIVTLSGGNQQKVTFSRLLALQPKVMILDEPTRGIDIGAKAEIHQIIEELSKQGIAIIVISSELPEVMAISDRIMTMAFGKATCIYNNDANLTQETLLKSACLE